MSIGKYFTNLEENSIRTNISDFVHIGSFYEACREIFDEEDLLPNNIATENANEDPEKREALIKSEIVQLMEVEDSTIDELGTVCNPDKLMCGKLPDEIAHFDLAKSLPKGGEHLMCLGFRRAEKMKRTLGVVSSYHKNRFDIKHGAKTTDKDIDILDQPQVVVSVAFLEKNVKFICKVDREILVLPEQYLSVLLDRLVCVSDLQVPNECSENPDLPQDIRFDSLFKSSFLFIEGTFYNDFSDALCTDLSQPIIKWAQERNLEGSESFKTANMDKVTIADLNVRLGYPYLYQHQGDCEHVFMFTDIRLLHNEDCQDLNAYPVVIYKRVRYMNICQICNERVSRWITKEDTHIITDPGFFCERCFKMLHYDKDGQKKGKFLAYPYMDLGVYN